MIYIQAVNRELLIEKINKNTLNEYQDSIKGILNLWNSLVGINEFILENKIRIVIEEPRRYARQISFPVPSDTLSSTDELRDHPQIVVFKFDITPAVFNADEYNLVLSELNRARTLKVLYKDGKKCSFKIQKTNLEKECQRIEVPFRGFKEYIPTHQILNLEITLTANN
jgi:hypothetical protein